MEATWETAYQAIGVGHRELGRAQATCGQRSAGLGTAAAAYHGAANDYPRFERQIIRTVQDDGIASGTKQPHPELLRRYPNREHPALRPGTGRSAASGCSGRSKASSCRSATSLVGSSIAVASVAASSTSSARQPPSGYHRQAPAVPPPFAAYRTSSSQIGAGGSVLSEPVPGREVWMLGRGGGQQSSFDSCLVRK